MELLSKLWRRKGPHDPEGSVSIPGFTASDEARRQILNGTAAPGLLTDRLKFTNEKDLVKLPEGLRVRHLTIANCANFEELPEDLFAETALVQDCDNFSSIPKSLGVMSLSLQGCPNLKRLPEGLRWYVVAIRDCPNLRKLPQRCHFSSLDFAHSQLEEITPNRFVQETLVLEGSLRLKRISSTSVWSLNLRGCTGLTQLPDELEARFVDVSGCLSLRWQEFALTEMESLDISDCVQIDYLPDWLTVTSSIDVANTSLNGLPTWLRDCELLWRGVKIDERIAFHPETIDAEEILRERNVERRRVMLERVGMEKFFQSVKHEVVHADTDPGGDRQLLRWRFEDEDLLVLAVVCPSTGRHYFIRVPPFVRKCHQAAAWIAGLDNPDEYQPVVET